MNARPVARSLGGRVVPRNERPSGPAATIIPEASRYATAISGTDRELASRTIPPAYSTCDNTKGRRYPTRSASAPHTHSKRNMPSPNIDKAIPVSVGLACSWRSSSGTEI